MLAEALRWGNPFRVVKISKNEWSVKVSDKSDNSSEILTEICSSYTHQKRMQIGMLLSVILNGSYQNHQLDKEGSFSEFLIERG